MPIISFKYTFFVLFTDNFTISAPLNFITYQSAHGIESSDHEQIVVGYSTQLNKKRGFYPSVNH